MRLHAERPLYRPTNCVNLFLWDHCHPIAMSKGHVDARSANDRQPPIEPAADKHVAGEKRQREQLLPILPAAYRIVKRKKYLEALRGKYVRHHFFMLMTCIDHPPLQIYIAGAVDHVRSRHSLSPQLRIRTNWT
jgi:hypothetical protein